MTLDKFRELIIAIYKNWANPDSVIDYPPETRTKITVCYEEEKPHPYYCPKHGGATDYKYRNDASGYTCPSCLIEHFAKPQTEEERKQRKFVLEEINRENRKRYLES